MGLHSREDVKAAIETHHQPVVGPVGWSSGGYIGSLTPHAVPFHPRSPAHYMPKPLPGRVAVLPYMHEQPITYTGPPLPWVQPGPAALWTTPTAIPILPPPPPPPPLPLPQPPPPYDGRPRPSHMVDDRPRTRHLLDDMHFPAVRGRTPNPYGAIGSALPTRGNP
ncbi:uncharacterized protein EI90DRAFT_3062718 [Cantharellus anzutake]|uniref:uncharacterized protein n=1 Tax=Cantharellus anzutake TaxID=1750568 RepID=UPI00190665D2|nr:uncharacterized protein EI90DRAFT_3062718 [Cantharellus anzutake]KAF8329467.1 hypothetical protein EI90DRAFT_3062718 [Cantharellus anzutake]